MENWLIWLIVTALLIIIELFTLLVATFCLAVGCLFAMVVSLLGMGIEMQLVSLIVGTIVAFVAFAPAVRRWQKKREGIDGTEAVSNMDALKGRKVEVIERIPEYGLGRVRVDGDRWQARCVDGTEVPVGTRVRIVDYDSIILEVEKL
ncbi:MAG: NfeD family protein [Bacteroidales bacterium]|nr:NfeD family protein [Bacteroidales bacterium]